ncbi:MAG: branched chain amino acid aminotransferase [Planctomycetota bacterium]|nr:MAG: branched chain amino acid aminotransferase [Planctomycetota bacterium]
MSESVNYGYLNGEFKPVNEINVSIESKGFNYGLGCFGGVRAYWNETQSQLYIFRALDHFKRLALSAKILVMSPPNSPEESVAILKELLRKNDTRQNTYIRPLLYHDSNEITPEFLEDDTSFAIYTRPLNHYFNTDTGLKLCVSSWRRISDNSIPGRIKATGAYVNSALAKHQAKKAGYDDAIFLTESGEVSEASAAHIFIVRNGKLISPPSTTDNLEGITRRTVLEIVAPELGLEVEERKISRTELYVADEVFLCGTGAEIAPVTEIDSRIVGDGKVGEISKKCQSTYWDIAKGNNEKYLNLLTPIW